MGTQGIVEALNVGKYVSLRQGTSGVVLEMDQLTFEATEEIFGHGVIIGIAPAGHALSDAVGFQALPVSFCRVLDTTVAVED